MQRFIQKLRSGWASTPAWLIVVIALTIATTLLRFVALDRSPPGFYVDEAAISAQVICLRQSGADVYGNSWPLLSQVLGGGYVTPAYLYTGFVWTSLFGDSVAAIRAMVAFFGALTVVGTFFLGRRLWRSREAAWLCALCVALSPWAFQFSRIAWDPPLAPCFLVASLYFLLRNGRRLWLDGALSGLFAALAMYSYPPLRVQVVLLLPCVFLFLVKHERRRIRALPAFFILFGIALLPLTKLTLTGEIQGRFNVLSIFNEAYLRQYGGFSVWTVTKLFLENLQLHFTPSYLFVSGDGNLRHSTQAVGEWSWLEALGLIVGLALLVRRRLFSSKRERDLAVLLIIGYFAAVVPAAMTWESNPHALRSIGAFPFLGLLMGGVLAIGSTRKTTLAWIAVATATAFALWFQFDFFARYPERSTLWFDQPVRQTAEATGAQADGLTQLEAIRRISPDYPEMGILYYQLKSGERSCRRR